MDFGDQIRALRQGEGLTQEQLAQRLMVTRQAVSNWERGSNLPDIETLIRIATTFDVSLDRLILGREGDGRMDERIKTNESQGVRDARDGAESGKLAEKLIRDGSEGRRARTNMATVAIGCALMVMDALCAFVKANYQMPMTCCMSRLAPVMPAQHTAPSRMGLPPERTSLTTLLLRPMAAMAITMRSLLSSRRV